MDDGLSNLTDQELVSLCQARSGKDERPFAELFRRYHLFVRRVLFRYFIREQDVEDLTQEVFLRAYHGLQQFAGRSSLKTWLFSIAANSAKNELRKRSRRPAIIEQALLEFEEQLPDFSVPDYQYIFRQQAFEKSFSQLAPAEQQILQLKDIDELTYQEIAGHLNISVSAAKMRVQRARLAMKTFYQENTYEQ